jgi:hypothetical protein
MGFLTLLEFYTMRKIKSAERPKTNFSHFFSFCYTPGKSYTFQILCEQFGCCFHIWCKRLDLFWSVRGLTSKMPTYPTCQLAPLSPIVEIVNVHFFCCCLEQTQKGQRFFCPKPSSGWSEKFYSLFLEKG